MNSQSTHTDHRGILLTDNVDLEWLKQIEPRYFPDYVKFTIDKNTNKICVGMEVHKDCELCDAGKTDGIYGGNIYFDDGHIVYSSTLNVDKNLKNGQRPENMRIIEDEPTIEVIDSVLKAWVLI